MMLYQVLFLPLLVVGAMLDRFDTFHRDDQLDGQKICPVSERVFKKIALNENQCAAWCHVNSECNSLFYGVTDHACYGCKRDVGIYPNDLSLVDTGSQTIYLVKGRKFSMTCSEILAESPTMTSGRYFNMYGMEIYCDMETDGGGWTVFQRRLDNSTDFYRTWTEYKLGFGKINGGEFWLGLEKLYRILHTRTIEFKLRVDLEGEQAEVYALYQYFDLGGEAENYTLHGGNYSGTAGDSLFSDNNLNGRMFSTKDADNDRKDNRNCAEIWSGGWWFNEESCCQAMLNGPFGGFGLFWNSWRDGGVTVACSMEIKEK